jgi:hypothetical protein
MTTFPPTRTLPSDASPVDVAGLTVGVLGGTEPQGRGLAVRLAAAGQRILLGSQDAARAPEVAAQSATGSPAWPRVRRSRWAVGRTPTSPPRPTS